MTKIINWKTKEVIFESDNSLSDMLEDAAKNKIDLSYAFLEKESFSWLNLTGINLSNARLNFSSFFNCQFAYSSLKDAHAFNAFFVGSDFKNADLAGVLIRYSNFEMTNMEGSNMEGADLFGANFSRANLSNSKSSFKNLNVENLFKKLLDEMNKLNLPLNEKSYTLPELIINLHHHGDRLARQLSPYTAAALISHSSTGIVPNFFDSNHELINFLTTNQRKDGQNELY